MNKLDILNETTKSCGFSFETVNLVVDSFLSHVQKGVSSGDKVCFINFGTFHPKKVQSKHVYVSGKYFILPSRFSVRFKPSLSFYNSVRHNPSID